MRLCKLWWLKCQAQRQLAAHDVTSTHSLPFLAEKAHLNLQAKTAQVDELNASGSVCWYYVIIAGLIVLLVLLIGTHGGKDIFLR